MEHVAYMLSAAAALLSAVQSQPNTPPATAAQAVRVASQAVQFAEYSRARKDGPLQETPNESVWPRIAHLRRSLYFDADGRRVPLGAGVSLIETYTSFGDLNDDGLDDAVVVTRKNGSHDGIYSFAATVNIDRVLFDVAEVPLGKTLTVHSHRVTDGGFVAELETDSRPRKTVVYKLLGNRFEQSNPRAAP